MDYFLEIIKTNSYLWCQPQENMINEVIRIHHDELKHVGIDRTIHSILSHYWFPCMKLRVRQYIDNCVKCLTFSIASDKSEGEMIIVENQTALLQTLYVDHFGPLEET